MKKYAHLMVSCLIGKLKNHGQSARRHPGMKLMHPFS